MNIIRRGKHMKMSKGQIAVTGSVVTVLIVAVMVLIGGLTYGYIRDAITTPMSNLGSTDFNNTVTTIDSNTWAGLGLMSVAVIVLAAVSILGIVLLLKAVA
jgi:hypothetical protein